MDDATGRAWLADWRRRVAELYATVRATASTDPAAAWDAWRAEREALYRGHPQSPVPVSERAAFRARHWPYEDRLRFEPALEPVPASAIADPPLARPNSGSEGLAFDRAGLVRLPLPSLEAPLALFWMRGYAGGLFLPIGDATNGTETYAAGRYRSCATGLLRVGCSRVAPYPCHAPGGPIP